VEGDFMEMFTYPLKYGDPASIREKGNIIISTELSDLMFGEGTNSLGKLIKVNREGTIVSFQVTGVLEKIPQNTSMQVDGLVSFEHFLDFGDLENNSWRRLIAATYIMIEDESRTAEVEEMLQSYIPLQNQARKDWLVNDFYLEPMSNMAFAGRNIRSHWMYSAPHEMIIVVPPVMAILMLLIACFNFTNTSIAISSKRLKEIGVRKVMGSGRKQLIIQFLGENMMLCFLALVVSLGFASWMVPAYSEMWPGIDLHFNLTKDIGLIGFLIGLLLMTALIAGAYPSLYISGFEPVSILRGTIRVGKTNWFSYSLLTFQYTLTVIALIASVAFTRNAMYQEKMDLGYKKDAVIFVNLDAPEQGKALKNMVSQQSFVKAASLSYQHVSSWTYSRTLKNADKEVLTDMMRLGPEYMQTMELEIVKGRAFDNQNKEIDKKSSIIVNEEFVRAFGWENPIGQRVSIGDSVRLNVVGVVKDFYNNGFWAPIDAIAIRPSADEEANFLVLTSEAQHAKKAMQAVEEAWSQVAPNEPFYGNYQEVTLSESIEVNKNIVVIFSFLGLLAVTLSAIGMFTLVSLNVLRRVKEIGVRKVLGAGTSQILSIMSRSFLVVLLIATLAGAGTAIFCINLLMAQIFTYYQTVDLLTVFIPVMVIVLISLGISSARILSTAQKNPVESLRYE
ncbi:MAG: FtsX-like permease family protein, partial [Bacteroidota bacterium]